MNAAWILEAAARKHPERPALKGAGMELSYGALDALVNRVANGLSAAGLGRGDAVALLAPSIPPFVITYFAILKIGAVAVPLNLLLKRDEIAHQLRSSRARAFICFEGTEAVPMGREGLAAFNMSPECTLFWAMPASPHGLTLLEGCNAWPELMAGQSADFESVDCPADAVASITYTSGTTGLPKGAEYTHTNEYLNAVSLQQEAGVRPDDVVLAALPLFSAWRCGILHTTFLAGARLVLLPRFDPMEMWQTIASEKVTALHAVAPMFFALHQTAGAVGVDLDAIAGHWRTCFFGGAPVDLHLRQFFEQRFGLRMLHGYGLTEIFFAVQDKAPAGDRPGLLGKPVSGVQVRVVDDEMNDLPHGEHGEIVVRTPMLMKGYHNDPEATAEAMRGGWFHTGDVGALDEHGNLYLLDRKKDMINRGGFKVYPAEIEAVMRQHPAVAQVALIGMADPRVGEEVKACVVLAEGADVAPEEIVAWTRERVAAHAYPRVVEILDALPLSPTGKILKRLLREAPLAAE